MFSLFNSHNNFVICCDTALQIWKLTLREINQMLPDLEINKWQSWVKSVSYFS